MALELDSIVPFGRSLNEYRLMFSLSEEDLQKRILGVGDGPASFNAEVTALGGEVVSIDPIYAFSAEEIQKRFYEVLDTIIDHVRDTPEDWVWGYHGSPGGLQANRENVMAEFVEDYELGKKSGRYLEQSLPNLGFPKITFGLAVCSHLLFLYSDKLSYEFHRESLLEILKVADEVRVFPLLTMTHEQSPYVLPLMQELEEMGYQAKIQKVNYELQRGGNQMLVVRRV